MNTTIFWRLLWKEYRLQRSLWIAIAVLGLFIELWILAIHRFGGGVDQAGFVTVLYGAAMVLAWSYAMGCGAVLFAAERENGTYDFQRVLPIQSRQVFGVKVLFALVSTVVLMGVLLLLAAVLSGWARPSADDVQMQWGVIGFASLEVLAWTILFSLLLHGPLKAAIFGVTVASFVTYFLLSRKLCRVTALEPRAAVVALVAAVDCVLGWRWFRDSTRSASGWASWTGRLVSLWPARGWSASGVPAAPFRATMLARLTWQHWRQSGWMLAGLGILSVLAVALTMVLDAERKLGTFTRPASALRSSLGFVANMEFWFLISALAPTFLGVFAFRADQAGASFRFLADRGVSPRLLWWSRQLSWLTMVAMGTAFMLLALGLLMPIPDQLPGESQQEVTNAFFRAFFPAGRVLALVSFGCAIGQLCSMLLASGILASVLAVVLSILAASWIGCITYFRMNWLWAVAPFPLTMLLATWLRAPAWMAERRRLRNWLLPGAAVMVPTLAVLTTVFLVRAYEVPDVSPGFSLEEYAEPASPEAQETAQMYLRAMTLYVPWNMAQQETANPVFAGTFEAYEQYTQRRTAAMLEANRESLAITLAATRRHSCDFLAQSELLASPKGPISPETPRRPDPGYLGALVAMSASSLQRTGDLNEARERWFAELRLSSHLRQRGALCFGLDTAAESEALRGLTDWAAQPGQSSQKVLQALHDLERILAGVPSPSEPIQWAYWHSRRLLLEQPAPRANQPLVAFWLHTLPWERERTRRVLDQIAATGMETVNEIAGQIAAGKNPRLERFSFDREDWRRHRNAWVRNTFLGDYYSYASEADFQIVVRKYARMETQRRATRLLLALQAWRLDHGGRLPKSLDALEGKYLKQIPLDPCSGEPFRYYAEGRPTILTPQQTDYWLFFGTPIEAQTPFLWSIGSIIELGSTSVVSPCVIKLDRYRIGRYGQWRFPSCEEDLLVHGWAFPLRKATAP